MRQYSGLFKEEVQDWLDMWKDMRRTFADALTECSSHSASPPSPEVIS